MHPALAERSALCDLFDDLGSDAPTLCEGWRTAHLAAHLLVRERRPDAAAGLVIKPLHGWTERVEERTRRSTPYPVVVRRLRRGPRLRPAGSDTHEWFVHHEDVRRANGMGPREEGPELDALDDAVWGIIPVFGPILSRRVKATIVLVSEDGRRRRIRRGPGTVELHGRPTELLLALFDRRSVAQVEAVGDDAAVEAWASAPLGV